MATEVAHKTVHHAYVKEREIHEHPQASIYIKMVGSSLQVYSGFRFCRQAEKHRIPIVIVNEGQTRADDLATLKISANAMQRLVAAIDELAPSTEKKTA